jgi:hypothetical protein
VFLAARASRSEEVTQEVEARVSKDAEYLGMKSAHVNGPISLFVNKDFPKQDNFKLFDQRQQMMVATDSVNKDEHNGATRKAVIGLNTDFEMTCYYSVGDKGSRVREITLLRKDKLFVDMNADGFYDLVVSLPTKSSTDSHALIQVWFDGQWKDVTRDRVWGVYRRNLRDGGVVEFDRRSGVWRSYTH